MIKDKLSTVIFIKMGHPVLNIYILYSVGKTGFKVQFHLLLDQDLKLNKKNILQKKNKIWSLDEIQNLLISQEFRFEPKRVRERSEEV